MSSSSRSSEYVVVSSVASSARAVGTRRHDDMNEHFENLLEGEEHNDEVENTDDNCANAKEEGGAVADSSLEGSTSTTAAAAALKAEHQEEEDDAVEVDLNSEVPSDPFASDADNDTPFGRARPNINVPHTELPAQAGGDVGVANDANLPEGDGPEVREVPAQAVSTPTDLPATNVPTTNTPAKKEDHDAKATVIDGTTAKRFGSFLFAVCTKPITKVCVSVLVVALLIAVSMPHAVRQWERYVDTNDRVHAATGTFILSGNPDGGSTNKCTQYVPFPSPLSAVPRLLVGLSGYSSEPGSSFPSYSVPNITADGLTLLFDCTLEVIMFSYMALVHAHFPSTHFHKLPGDVNSTTNVVSDSSVIYRVLDLFSVSSPTTIYAPSSNVRPPIDYDFYSSHWECVGRGTDKEICQILYSSNPDVHVGAYKCNRGGISDDTCSVAIRTPHHCDGELLVFVSFQLGYFGNSDMYRTVFTTNVTSNSFTITQNCSAGGGCNDPYVFYAAVCYSKRD